MKKTLSLFCCLLFNTLYSGAQIKTEVSYWQPKHKLSRKLVSTGTTITLWHDSLPVEIREYNGTALKTLTLYNTYGQPTELLHYAGTDTAKLAYRTVYTYDSLRQKTTETEYWPNSTVRQTRNYSYNPQGQLDQVNYTRITKGDKQDTVSENYSYDNQGRLSRKTKTHSYNEYPEQWHYEYSRDEKNLKKVTELYTRTNRKPSLSKTWTYDDSDRLIREFENHSGGSEDMVRTFVYAFDEHGNWTTKKVYEQRSIYNNEYVGEYRQSRSE